MLTLFIVANDPEVQTVRQNSELIKERKTLESAHYKVPMTTTLTVQKYEKFSVRSSLQNFAPKFAEIYFIYIIPLHLSVPVELYCGPQSSCSWRPDYRAPSSTHPPATVVIYNGTGVVGLWLTNGIKCH